METRAYFLLGDLASNCLAGFVAALACAWLFREWPMIPGMIIAMVVGMALAMALCFAFLIRLFGAMEVMLQTMLTGMLAGMFAQMAPIDADLLGVAVQEGVSTGIAVFAACWVANSFFTRTRQGQ